VFRSSDFPEVNRASAHGAKKGNKMSTLLDKEHPVLFLGLADHLEPGLQEFPVGGVDLFQLSHHKVHIIYPGLIGGNVWLFLVSTDFLRSADLTKWTLQVMDANNNQIGFATFAPGERTQGAADATLRENESKQPFGFWEGSQFTLLPVKFEGGTIITPGRCAVQSVLDGKILEIGSVEFHYKKMPGFTADQITAIEADPDGRKIVRMELGCKYCQTKARTYAGLKRSPQMEKEGYIWYSDLGERFRCECGRTDYSLEYLRDSMHGLLSKDVSVAAAGVSYVRQYGHAQVVRIVGQYVELLDQEKLEPPVQAFLEKNVVLFARFNAKRLWVKPSIIGLFQADFAVLDTSNHLWFIELERPSIKLFKKSGHPTGNLMHAYEQVRDWLHQYARNSQAVLDVLKLKREDVVTVRGVVIAGRSATVSHEVLQRHLSMPPYANIDFMTLDDLGTSLLNLSKKLI